jgi:allantoicase
LHERLLQNALLKENRFVRYCSWFSYWRTSFRLKREAGFIEINVARGDNSTGFEIQTPITSVISRVTEENTR